jgi:hypothetical protein
MDNHTRLRGKIATIDEARAFHVARLGGECACCGETTTEFLEVSFADRGPGKHCGFDHPKGFYAYVDSHPDTPVEVLCANCNHARLRFGTCPHKSAADRPDEEA